ncbi:DNA mismatch repair protein MutL [hydrothermal vent metagenome]|uniref:DNA mismatch repair protein MutL n=1 Tax=hydrothermal vent metagenome TaxID=652676 RepID=A0A3B0V820_9ZZZZ
MPSIIQLLPDAIANQIAAGEVVQRPSSALKELLENAVDAGATHIKVIIKEAGKSLIQVIDNGSGMNETDARMSLERHATSKIKKAEDLFALTTMGFRGEAIASIAAVSQLEIKTKMDDQELGTSIEVAGSEIIAQQPVSCAKGTSITVRNLFYNIPARRNFLKSNGVETRHLVDEFQRIALANPAIEFEFYQNDLETYNLPSGKLSQRIVGLFGQNYKEQLATCNEETDSISIKGYIGKPEFAKKSRGEQFFFVNNRFIKSPYLHHAILHAYQGLLQQDAHPFYVLFIEMDPSRIDVNVHPTKTEIKFDDERTVYGVLLAAIRQALGAHNLGPAIDFDSNVNFAQLQPMNIGQSSSKDTAYTQFKNIEKDPNLKNWESLYTEEIKQSKLNFTTPSESFTVESALNDSDNKKIGNSSVKFQLHNQYIFSQVKSGVLLIDQEAAHERILFEKYQAFLQGSKGQTQQLLFPINVELNPANHALVLDMKTELASLGFAFEEFGQSSVVINGAPLTIVAGQEKTVFEGLIDQFKINKSSLTISTKENLSRALAKRSCIKAGQVLAQEEINAMIDELFGCEVPNFAPDGRSTYFVLDLNQIKDFF